MFSSVPTISNDIFFGLRAFYLAHSYIHFGLYTTPLCYLTVRISTNVPYAVSVTEFVLFT